MKLATTSFLILPTILFTWFVSLGRDYRFHNLNQVLLCLFVLLVFGCLAWGVFIYRRSHISGWLCIGLAVIYLAMIILPLFARARVGRP
jgi:hypothetical protein